MNSKKNFKHKLFSLWPGIVLSGLVLCFCVFVGISSLPLLKNALAVLKPTKPQTYAQALKAVDSAYAKGLFSTSETTQSSSKTVNDKLKSAFVDINGRATQALGQRQLNNIIKLDNGAITAYLSEKQDLSHQVTQTLQLAQLTQQSGGNFVFVMAPHLINKYQPLLPAGFVDYFNETADEFLVALENEGVATIDLREIMRNEGFDHYGGFFKTDHHWTPAAASWANSRVMEQMQLWGWFDQAKLLPSPDDFEVAGEGVRFYGTAAERTGEAFAGQPDTLFCLQPKADVPLFTKRLDEEQFSGPVSFSAVYRDWQNAEIGKIYNADAYYLYKTMYEMNVLNENAPINTKMMMISDSFGVPFQSFAACYVRQLTCFDGREHSNLSDVVGENNIIMVLFNPSSLDISTENQTIFNFL